ncbi:unnamed protein product, partial [marine sediment metagenome]
MHCHFRTDGATPNYCDFRCIEASVCRLEAYAINFSDDMVVFDQLPVPYVAINHGDENVGSLTKN